MSTRRRHTLDDGTKLVTGSGCRYVTFAISNTGDVEIVRRTDDEDRAITNHRDKVARTERRVVTVDFHADSYGGTATFRDSTWARTP